MSLHNCTDSRGSIFGGRAARSTVFYFVLVTALIEVTLQSIGVGLAGLEPIAGGDTVSVADDCRPFGAESGQCWCK